MRCQCSLSDVTKGQIPTTICSAVRHKRKKKKKSQHYIYNKKKWRSLQEDNYRAMIKDTTVQGHFHFRHSMPDDTLFHRVCQSCHWPGIQRPDTHTEHPEEGDSIDVPCLLRRSLPPWLRSKQLTGSRLDMGDESFQMWVCASHFGRTL